MIDNCLPLVPLNTFPSQLHRGWCIHQTRIPPNRLLREFRMRHREWLFGPLHGLIFAQPTDNRKDLRGAQWGHETLETNTKGRELMRTNLLGSRSDPAFWTDSSVCLSYDLEIVVKLKLCWVRT